MMNSLKFKQILIKNLSELSLSFWIGLILIAIFISLALISFFWTPYDITLLEISERLKTPSLNYILGTDHFGRDIPVVEYSIFYI